MFTVQNIVSVTDFRQNLNAWLDRLTSAIEPIIIVQNSKPKAALVDPEYLEYLENYANGFYDKGDAAEVKRAIAAGELKKAVPFKAEDYL